jgi:protein gp37
MGDSTGISWTDATWNPVRGCSRVSAGCQRCYAEQQAARIVRMGNGKPTAYDGLVKLVTRNVLVAEPRWTGVVRLVPEHLADPIRWKRPRRIFVNSMSDLFHESLTNEQIAAVFGVMAAAPQHTFQILTKRAKRMREWFAWARAEAFEFGESVLDYGLMLAAYVGDELGEGSLDASAAHSTRFQDLIYDAWARIGADGGTVLETPWPLPNVWLGVSVENQDAADERTPELLRTPAAVRFLSCEPLLGPVDLHAIQIPGEREGLRFSSLQRHHDDRFGQSDTTIDQVIAGCESGPGARPCDVTWLQSLRDQCAAADVAYFLKQAVELTSSRAVYPSKHADRVETKLVALGAGSKRKPGGVIELPYLDGVQHAAFPEVRRG